MELLAKVLPILILFGAGYLIRKTGFLSEEAINGFKKLVIDIALPAVLFIIFVNLDFKKEYLGLIVSIILLCCVMLAIGFLLNKIPSINNPILPFVMSGFTFGLLGIPLYNTVFGEANLPSMAVMGIGQELFLWFVYVSVMKVVLSKEKVGLSTFKGFLTSPLIIALVSGLAINLLGFSHLINEQPILNGFYVTLEYFSKIATPLILMVIGYGLAFNKEYTRLTVIYVTMRFAIMLSIGYIIKFLIIDRFMVFDKYLEYAFFTLLILPPPFSLSVLVGKYGDEENAKLANNITVVYTCLCIVTYIIYMFVISG